MSRKEGHCLLLVGLFAVIGCGAGDAVKGDSVSLVGGRTDTLNPLTTYYIQGLSFRGVAYDTLISYDEKLNTFPGWRKNGKCQKMGRLGF